MFSIGAILFLLTSWNAPPGGAEDYELWKQARTYWYQDDWQNAAGIFQELIEKYPDSPRRCKSEIYLGYCFDELKEKKPAFETFDGMVSRGVCKDEILIDAKSKRLQLAYEMIRAEPGMKQVLLSGLKDPNRDIRLQAAVWLSKLDDKSGLEVFFQVVREETDQDLRDTAVDHILKLGSAQEKTRLQTLLEEVQQKNAERRPKMVRLIIRDLKTNEETLKLNLPISLIKVAIRSLSPEHLKLIHEQVGIDLQNPDLNLEDLPAGKELFRVVDGDRQEIKLFLE